MTRRPGEASCSLPAAAFAGALAALPGVGPATLHGLLSQAGPIEVWDGVRRGEIVRPPGRGVLPSEVAGRRVGWADAAAQMPLQAWWEAWCRRGIEITWLGDGRFPDRLRCDPEPPGVLFWRGCLDRLSGRCVAVVGTRRCSPDGRASAYDLGRDLANAGVCVVSGLALGIDGAAHLGALDAKLPALGAGATVGVAASGVDVAYPASHAALWERVVAAGAVISETPPGRPAQAWRFPSRNRVIAGLVDMVVVVESHASGGSLITADKALDRGIEVRVVPGGVHAPSTAGSNQLLYDGPGPVRDATDVLDALGMVARRPRRIGRRRPPGVGRTEQPRLHPEARQPRLQPDGVDPGPSSTPAATTQAAGAVLEAVGWRPTSINRIVDRSGQTVGAVGRILEGLRDAGAVEEDNGWWWRSRVGDVRDPQ